MKKTFFQSFVVFVLFLMSAQVFADSIGYVRIKSADIQPIEENVYGREVALLTSLVMKPVTPEIEKRPAMLQNLSLQIIGISAMSSAINQVVLILEQSKGVDDIEVGRIVGRGFYSGSGNDFVTLYPVEGWNIIHFRKRIKMTVAAVMNNDMATYADITLSCNVTGASISWPNGTSAEVRGFSPIIGNEKIIKTDVAIGTINEVQASSFGALQYEVPEESSEDVRIKKFFIPRKIKGLKLLVQGSDGTVREFRCRKNAEVTVCDFGGDGLLIEKGTSVIITANRQGVLYTGYDPINIWCEGSDTGRRFFVTPLYFGGKG